MVTIKLLIMFEKFCTRWIFEKYRFLTYCISNVIVIIIYFLTDFNLIFIYYIHINSNILLICYNMFV